MLLLCYQVFSYWLAVKTGGKIFLHSISRLCVDDDDGVLWSRGNVQKQISKHYFFTMDLRYSQHTCYHEKGSSYLDSTKIICFYQLILIGKHPEYMKRLNKLDVLRSERLLIAGEVSATLTPGYPLELCPGLSSVF